MGNLTAKVDAVAPEIDGTVSGSQGENNWFTTEAILTASATDALPGSGLNTFETTLDGSNWTAYNAPLNFSDGIHQVQLKAIDYATNITEIAQEIKVDTLPPTINGTLAGTLGAGNWYISSVQASAEMQDATSGIALTEYSLDEGVQTQWGLQW